MTRMVVLGAGGKAGRAVVAEAVRRGIEVTAVVRNPKQHNDFGDLVSVRAGDVTVAEQVAELTAGHDAAVSTAIRLDIPATEFFEAATSAIVEGAQRARLPRLVLTGIGTLWETAPGERVMDADGFPEEWRSFSDGHVRQLEIASAATDLDWVIVAPPPVMLDSDEDAVAYRVAASAAESTPFSYADLAVALVDEALTPEHRRTMVQVARA